MEELSTTERLILDQKNEIIRLRGSNNDLGELVGTLRGKLIEAQAELKNRKADDVYLQRRLLEELWKDGDVKPLMPLRSMDSLSYSLTGENGKNLKILRTFLAENELAFLKKGRAGWTALEPKNKVMSVFDRTHNII